MGYCEACANDKKIICESPMKFTADSKKTNIFARNIDLTARIYRFDDPDVFQLDSRIEETVEDCMQ